jgi:hypothetical protein
MEFILVDSPNEHTISQAQLDAAREARQLRIQLAKNRQKQAHKPLKRQQKTNDVTHQLAIIHEKHQTINNAM